MVRCTLFFLIPAGVLTVTSSIEKASIEIAEEGPKVDMHKRDVSAEFEVKGKVSFCIDTLDSHLKQVKNSIFYISRS